MESFKIRPHARILAMLGDQLIKNETIALTELVKNAYDADATVCNVKFENFSEDFSLQGVGKIIIEDNGYGMSYDTITTHFLNPATPAKKLSEELRASKKGRISQGEKGIGRFAMLKLGRKITILSKQKTSEVVHKVIFDFSNYDDEFITELEKVAREKKEPPLFLDQIDVTYEECKVAYFGDEYKFTSSKEGTAIIIECLKSKWSIQNVEEFTENMLTFMPFELDDKGDVRSSQEFDVVVFRNERIYNYKTDKMKHLSKIIAEKAFYDIKGRYDETAKQLIFSYIEAKGKPQNVVIELGSTEILNQQSVDFKGLTFFKKNIEHFFEEDATTECGNFNFAFYVFDFDANQYEKFGLNKVDKNIIRDHRIFLYRDGIRVQPYGATDDDWLQIDRNRAETRAGKWFSNNQMIGQINITKKGNEKLRDKTSREGIIEDSDAFKQLIRLVAGVLTYMRVKPFQNYLAREVKKNEINEKAKQIIREEIEQLREKLSTNPEGLKAVEKLEKTVYAQENSYKQRLALTEQLAGVGLSVEMASHDLMLSVDRLKDIVRQIYIETKSPLTCNIGVVHKDAETAESLIGLIYMRMKDIQQLFVSSKQRSKLINVEDIIKKIQSIYAKAYKSKKIKVTYEKLGSPVKAKLVDAVLFQVFINLFDNSLYWLEYSSHKDREVKITLDGTSQTAIFSDNGPGIQDSDAPYIFEAFYSGKGDEGRGLGLYIARKLLEKNDYEIDIITNDKQKILQGANFAISFVGKEA